MPILKKTYTIANLPFSTPPADYRNVPRFFAVSDLHGEYEHLVRILQSGAVIDSNLHWNYGTGHLVIDGDIFDRGDKVTECLWLIYHLEQEASLVGGRVHTLLGNHELMVLRGDNRYIDEKYLNGISRKSRISHVDLFGPDSELGRWLRSKNSVEKIDDILFVHGGLSPFLIDSGYTIASINQVARTSLDLRSSQLLFADSARFLYGSKGPFWYRGYHYEMEDRYPMATTNEIDRVLDHFDAASIVVGHSEVDSISTLFDSRLIGIDVPVDELGSLQALVREDGKFYRLKADGTKTKIE
ncbi:MAG: metallophosphoesterase [bacterium]|nr:metallophosphoesterase [bacterium]